jgi:serine/threonine protein kinase
MTFSQGSKLGPYVIVDLIGKGGMGEVYSALDPRLDRSVALKVLSPVGPANDDHVARFAQEARTCALLNHPNIVAVYDVGTYNGLPFVVSELLQGESLRARIKEGGMPAATAIRYALQIVEGLAAAHQLDVVHRDLKPENLFITHSGRLKILDFGLAKCRQHAVEQLHHDSRITTQPGLLLGTIGYMSPEQVRGAPVDHRSDIFSLGVILYEMISGKAPFHGDSAIETLNAILKEEPARLRYEDRDMAPELERVIRHCLEKEPDARFQSARDLGFNLDLAMTSLQRPRRHDGGRRGLLGTLLRMM